MEKELHRLGIDNLDYKALAPKLNLLEADDVLVALGRGDLRPVQVINIAREIKSLSKQEVAQIPPTQMEPTSTSTRSETLMVQGVGNLLTHMAGCCRPVRGDNIIGYITQGEGISIHRRECANIRHAQETRPERLLDVTWGGESLQKYPIVTIEVTANDRHNLLRDITQVFANDRCSILSLNSNIQAERSPTLPLLSR